MEILKVRLSANEVNDLIDRAATACRYWAHFDADKQAYCDAVILHHEGGFVTVSQRAVEKGVCLALAHGVRIPADGDLEAADLPTVDAIVQYGVFGKLVYG